MVKKLSGMFQRRQLLVDRNIQLPLLIYSLFMAGLGIVIASLSSVLVTIVAVDDYPDWLLPTIILGGGVIALLAMILVGLYITNKVAGPLLRMRMHMKELADGKPASALSLREGDFTKELLAEYNRVVEHVSELRSKSK